jgi:hypothetical protein
MKIEKKNLRIMMKVSGLKVNREPSREISIKEVQYK